MNGSEILEEVMEWKRRRLMIWGTTYPELSDKYKETVCTGAVDLDEKCLLRIFPMPMRYLPEDRQYKKWTVVHAETARDTSDPRPESHKIRAFDMERVGKVEARGDWADRRRYLFLEEFFVDGMEHMKSLQRSTGQSLGIVRPHIHNAGLERLTREQRQRWQEKYDAIIAQQDLWDPGEKPVPLPTFRPYLEFSTDNEPTTVRRIAPDWELHALANRCENAPDPSIRFREDFMDKVSGRDVHLALGSVRSHLAEFIVVAVFYPLPQIQLHLF